jgi:hypothetical protein
MATKEGNDIGAGFHYSSVEEELSFASFSCFRRFIIFASEVRIAGYLVDLPINSLCLGFPILFFKRAQCVRHVKFYFQIIFIFLHKK